MALLLLVGFGASPAAAQDVPDVTGFDTTRLLALGTGLRASALSTSALAVNPANLPLGSLYHLEGTVGYQPSSDVMTLQAGVVDSMTSSLAAGLGVRGFLETGDRGYSGVDVRLGFGLPLSEALSIGVSGRYLNLEDEVVRPNSTAREVLAKGVNLDAAVRLTPFQGLHLAALGYNLIDMNSPLAPVLVGGSATFTASEAISLGGDALVDLSTFDNARVVAGGGFEYLAAGSIPLRLGYRFDGRREAHALTAGLGYTDRQVGLDIGLRQEVAGGKATEIMAAVRYFVQ